MPSCQGASYDQNGPVSPARPTTLARTSPCRASFSSSRSSWSDSIRRLPGLDQPKKWNVLFLFSDDQRADTVAALGNKSIRTPNLDRLVHAGTAFTRAYCMGGQRRAVCVPSRAMLMSGRTLFRVNEKLDGQATWPEMFARGGLRHVHHRKVAQRRPRRCCAPSRRASRSSLAAWATPTSSPSPT